MSNIYRRWQRGTLRKLKSRRWSLRLRIDEVDPKTGSTRRRVQSYDVGDTADLRTFAAARAAADVIAARLNGTKLSGKTASVPRYLSIYEAGRLLLVRPSTQRNMRSVIRSNLRPAFPGLRLDQVSAGVLQGFISTLAGRGLKRNTIKTILKAWLRIAKAADADGYAVASVSLRDLKFPAIVQAVEPRPTFSAAEMQTLFGSPDPWGVVFSVQGVLGLRAGEVLGLTWADIELEAATVTLRRSAVYGQLQGLKTTRSAATLPLTAELVTLLRAWRERWRPNDAGLLFGTRTGRPMHLSNYARALSKYCKAFGLQRRGTHAFRHGAASLLLARGMSPAAVRDALRHASLQQTDAYSHVVSEDVRKGMNLLGDLIGGTPK